MNFYALDLETKSLDPEHEEYALQPWRIMEGKAEVLTISEVWKVDRFYSYSYGVNSLKNRNCLNSDDKYIWTWNGVFDIACLIASGIDVSKILWLDAMSAAKRVFRSQHTDHPNGSRPVSWSLNNMARTQLKDWEYYAEFMDVKKEFSFDEAYLRRRCELDTKATLLLGQKFWDMMTEQQRSSFFIESEALYPTALAWMIGTKYDFRRSKELSVAIMIEKNRIIEQLQFYYHNKSNINIPIDQKLGLNHDLWVKALGSNDQLASLLYDVWKIPFDEDLRDPKAKTDKRPVNKNVLTFLIERYGDKFPQLALIKKYRKLKSYEDKFIKGPIKTREYLGSDIMRHNCKLNSTYTGRTTYGSKL